jgi:hypothetical protein
MRVRRPKPYVCVDCDYAEHFRFQDTRDLEVAVYSARCRRRKMRITQE